VFISIEGGEGVGKSTFIKGLSSRLASRNLSIVTTYEPGGCPAAVAIRKLFIAPPTDDPFLPDTELLLVSAARFQHVKRVIEPALGEGKWVLSDRFYDSTRVYQGSLPGLSKDRVEPIIAWSVGTCHPDLTFLLDCDQASSGSRLRRRSQEEGLSRFDLAGIEYHQRLRQGYLDLQKRFPKRIHLLDASGTPEEIVDKAMHIIEGRWKL
jgi:dTMP kinase